jgi:DNA-directed RNA polymerase subunit beta'
MMGAEGIKELLKKVDVESPERRNSREDEDRASQQKKLKFAKRLRVVESSASPATSRSG